MCVYTKMVAYKFNGVKERFRKESEKDRETVKAI
ncbi:hypothetical protein SAMN04488579_10271 [Eubacterium barkeri]|uniref:Uncharacterized protein n=1 Tax=Eubacterium barkeri TaxID=1528 RepID=A0A1H3BGV0_EUBBA|nr:hypothetical protein SAMN04488579_10271 [Eubacterium barkeri]